MKRYISGSLVLTKYFNFDKEEVDGLFLVLNDEALDRHTHHNGNLVVVKVTTQTKDVEGYSYPLIKSKYPFLLKDCFVQCNKIHTLNKTSITKSVGILDPYATNFIIDKVIELLKSSKR